jgi:hypothetical protein
MPRQEQVEKSLDNVDYNIHVYMSGTVAIGDDASEALYLLDYPTGREAAPAEGPERRPAHGLRVRVASEVPLQPVRARVLSLLLSA